MIQNIYSLALIGQKVLAANLLFFFNLNIFKSGICRNSATVIESNEEVFCNHL